ncbi:Asp23/Gls24 family envelope stress response protein [Fructobacillus ficulneus]|uniref:Alkaline shock protein n=1 Tax=Fructobacillus ficulneus TaxID=157463 RepID=A0A0K8MGJ9_9LACO|nr:Asp23/Gls24 family envelope stress response protein [Fructobacillus ficulneus]GAO99681.1 alkaline shock protein [Fructobacillus ficulneus]
MAKTTGTTKNFLLTAEEMADGQTMVARHALELIAQAASMEVDGVAGMQTNVYDHFPKSLTNIAKTKGVLLRNEEDGLTFDVNVLLEYGVVVPKVALAIQQSVKKNVADLTGLTATEVNVVVAGLVPDTQDDALDPDHLFDHDLAKEPS